MSKNKSSRFYPYPLLFVSFFLFSVHALQCETPNNERFWNDAARYLAGLPAEPESTLAALETRPEIERHRAYFQKKWPTVVQETILPQQKWAKEELADVLDRDRNVFYPFSGPDFLNIFTFFPNGEQYVLFGMEPAGPPPDPREILPARLPSALGNLQKSLSSILNFSFFRTLDMAKDLQNQDLKGTTPILLVFMARTDNRIVSVQNVALTQKGTLRPLSSKKDRVKPNEVEGVEILFTKQGEKKIRRVYYFSLDISNAGLRARPNLLAFLNDKGKQLSYLKAASYLMYRDTFSTIRNFILDKSDLVMQDDSGMPLVSFDTDKWDLTFYGNYTRPIPLFRSRYQKDLRAVYLKKSGIRELPFGIGYNFRKGQSNLMIARKK